MGFLRLHVPLAVWSLSIALSSGTEVGEAARKATEYILSKRDQTDGTWPPGERAVAVLGMMAQRPYRHQNLTKTEAGNTQVQLEAQSLAVDFLIDIRDVKAMELPGSPIRHMDETTLLGLFGALRGLCVDQHDYYGYDLVKECERRFRRPENKLRGGLALALCSVRRDFSVQEISDLVRVDSCSICPHYVEELSLNLLATICIAGNYKEGSEKRTMASDRVIPDLVSKLTETQLPDGGFGGLRKTSLALQSLHRAPADLVSDGVIQRGLAHLIAYQQDDGGFGGSIANTAVAMPALTGQTAADFYMLPCPEREKSSNVRVSFILNDSVFSMQSQRGHFYVGYGERVLDGLKRHARSNSQTFKLKLSRRLGVVYVKSLDGLGSNFSTRWLVFQIDSDGSRKDVTEDLESIRVTKDALFEFKLVLRVSG